MRLITFEEYRDRPSPDWEYLLPPFIPVPSVILLVGSAKTGKSTLAVQLALAIARGVTFFGKQSHKSPVLYLQFDNSETAWKKKLRDMEDSGVSLDAVPNLTIPHPDDTPRIFDVVRNPRSREWLAEARDKSGARLVFIDVLRDIHGSDEVKSDEMKRLFDYLTDIFHKQAMIILHHTNKAAEAEGYGGSVYTALRGSSYLAGRVDALWYLERKGKLTIETRFDESGLHWQLVRSHAAWTFPEEAASLSLTKKLLQLCSEYPAKSHREISFIAKERFSVSRATYYRHLAGQACSHHTPCVLGSAPADVPASAALPAETPLVPDLAPQVPAVTTPPTTLASAPQTDAPEPTASPSQA